MGQRILKTLYDSTNVCYLHLKIYYYIWKYLTTDEDKHLNNWKLKKNSGKYWQKGSRLGKTKHNKETKEQNKGLGIKCADTKKSKELEIGAGLEVCVRRQDCISGLYIFEYF